MECQLPSVVFSPECTGIPLFSFGPDPGHSDRLCHEAVPVLLIQVPENPEAGLHDGGFHLSLPSFDDAGRDEDPVPAKKAGDMDGERDDHI